MAGDAEADDGEFCFASLQLGNAAASAASVSGKNFTPQNVKETAAGFNGELVDC